METSYQQIIDAFVDKHGLTRGQVIAEIERTFSSMLSRWHKKNVVAVFADGQLSAVGYHEEADGPVQLPIDITTMRGWNTIKRILDKNLGTAACMDEVTNFKHKENEVVWGTVISRNAKGLVIELELEFGVTLFAICPPQYLAKHERNFLSIGDRKAFHLRKVESILAGGDTPRTQITVDRISKTLVEKLLRHELSPAYQDIKLCCRKRYAGEKSFVESSSFLPKQAILKVSQELGEHIQVKIRKEDRRRVT